MRVQLLAARLAISATRGAGVCGRGLRRDGRADSEAKYVTDDLTSCLGNSAEPLQLLYSYSATKSVTDDLTSWLGNSAEPLQLQRN